MQPLIRPFQDHAPAAIRHLVEAAEVLEVTEADVFRLAYHHWYGRELDGEQLDALFAGYLLREELPGWVRNYCSRVLNLADVGQLDPRDFGVERPRPETSRRLDQQFTAWLTLGGFVAYLLLLA